MHVIPFDKVINMKLSDKIKLFRLKTIIPLFSIVAILALSPVLANDLLPDAAAHAPTGVTVTVEAMYDSSNNRSQDNYPLLKINWYHGPVGACASSAACSANLAGGGNEVDIMRDSTNVANNVTGGLTDAVAGGSFIDGNTNALAQGTAYEYTVCHGQASTATCSDAHTDGTNEGKHAVVVNSTKGSPPCLHEAGHNGTSISECDFVADVTAGGDFTFSWTGPTYNNTDISSWYVEKAIASVGTFSNVTTVKGALGNTTGSGVKSINGTGLESGTEYYFRVSAVTDSGYGAKHIFQFRTPDHEGGTVSSAMQSPVVSNFTIGNELMPYDTRQSDQAVTVDSLVFVAGSSTNVAASLSDKQGWDRILWASVLIDDDTSVTWDYFDGTTVTDPNGYFRQAGVTAVQSGILTLDVDFAITFAKSVTNSDVTLQSSNFKGDVKTIVIKEAEEIVEVAEAPSNIVVNLELASPNCECGGVKYYTGDDVINVSYDNIIQMDSVAQEEIVLQQIFEMLTISQEPVRMGYEYVDMLLISGTISDDVYSKGHFLTFIIPDRDGTESLIKAKITSDRTFEVPINIDQYAPGKYQIQPQYWNYSDEILSEPVFFKVLE